MDGLLRTERDIENELESKRVDVVRKLLMMSANKRIPLSKLYHNRLLFGIPEDFRDRVAEYPDYFRVIIEDDGKRVLELVNWDSSLAVSALEKEFMVDEDKVKRAFKFPMKHGKALELDMEDERKLSILNTLPLVSPYSDGSKLDLWTLEAEKYRVGIIHEFLSLTLEKRAYIHNIVEFKEEFSLTKHTYQMLLKQPRTFYVAGTQMNCLNWLLETDEARTKRRKYLEKAKGLVAEYQPKYNSARAVYLERKKYVDEIDWNMLAVPPSGSSKLDAVICFSYYPMPILQEEMQWTAWIRLLSFEK
ncbi:protein WHAT'S THIS FACTOR 1, chloroplastic [Sesamum alatum]|uniref:Protein WHAT'S THIS FACTOR 1, chloroplastic n=1 Tax=Sesamum alatum TaxID=300844 RepID=A0AAE1Y7M0_9LAMI|nr:protein WHAT'S THIS FACTOR 1, chloroplastic [Sesamum alatum]